MPNLNEAPVTSTSLPIIALVSRIVTKVVDRITGDRVDYPLLVSQVCVEGLKNFGIEARVMFGKAAWVEVLEDQSVVWAGCWGENFNFWVATQFGEVIDLNTSVAHRKRSHSHPNLKPIYSPPMLWSMELPKFYKYQPEGVAEIDLHDEQDRKRLELCLAEVREKCTPAHLNVDEPEFPNEPILCPERKLLDDSLGTFKLFDRALAVQGIPASPF